MTNQGAPPQHRPEDGWWQAVYTGPADTLPDTPGLADALAEAATVDEWFDSAAGMIGPQRTPTDPVADPGPEPTVDEWFDSAAGMIGSQRTPDPAPEPAAPPADPVVPPTPAEPTPTPTLTPEPTPTLTPEPTPTPTPVQPRAGARPSSYGPEPTALPELDPDALAELVPDTVLDGAQYGRCTLRAASVRGDSARHRGEVRRDGLLVTRFGEGDDGLLLAVLGSPGLDLRAPTAVADACRQLAAAIGRSRAELAADLREGARDRLRYGLQRLATQAAAPLRTAAAPGPVEDGTGGSLHCLLISLDPAATHRAAFGIGPGGLYLLRSGHWIDAYAARLLHHPDGEPPVSAVGGVGPVPRPFRFRLVPATPGDILLLCTPGLAEPVAEEASVAHFLADHWAHPHPPGTVDFLRQVQVRAKDYAEDRTAVAVWTE
ncbi:protein phosphatase 2C domain-containing protein [Kitasatospora sp. McL0602]|uniref:protein phosphatase 2C domain-containing protein n=1 Tax=Kitasatospora sp. McL0602 TaxID=3439530 RepID=UPI003F8ABC74